MKIPENFFIPSKCISYEDYNNIFVFNTSYNKEYSWCIYINTNVFDHKPGVVAVAKLRDNSILILEDFKKFFDKPILEKFNLREFKLNRILTNHISPTTPETT